MVDHKKDPVLVVVQFSGGNDFMSTGVQQNRRDYLDRPAIFGPDERGGALSIWFVTEMESFLRES